MPIFQLHEGKNTYFYFHKRVFFILTLQHKLYALNKGLKRKMEALDKLQQDFYDSAYVSRQILKACESLLQSVKQQTHALCSSSYVSSPRQSQRIARDINPQPEK